MKSLLLSNKLFSLFFFLVLVISSNNTFAAVDIWKKKDTQGESSNSINKEEKIKIKSPILSNDINKITLSIDESELKNPDELIVGLFDPEDNGFNLNMWQASDGAEIKNVFKRIKKLKLSKFSQDLLFQVLFTNAYAPKANLNSSEFIKLKVDWLIENKRFKNLENLLSANPNMENQQKAIKTLINENLSQNNIKSACDKINSIKSNLKNNFLEKFRIYCLIKDNRNEEAQLVFDLLKENGFKEKFFEEKINILLGVADKKNNKIIDNNLFNFYLSHITSDNFTYEPGEKTNKYIWRYLSSANLIKTDDLENEEIIPTYEKAAAENSLNNEEVFLIYLRIPFNFNQLKNINEVYKNLPNYKARALVYQSLLLNDNPEKKIYLAFLLKDLFEKDNLLKVYSDELSNILKDINKSNIPDNYKEIVNKNINTNFTDSRKIKYDNSILHRSKVIKHFLNGNKNIIRTKKDFKVVYKKIKKNKKYFISIKDVIVIDSLKAHGFTMPEKFNEKISSQLTVPQNLIDLVEQNQIGLVMLKIIEIIGEDNLTDLDPETVYFLSSILNKLNMKKIRNNILIEVLPLRI